MNEKIQQIAAAVRDWAEEKAAGDRFPDDLCGLCAIASAELHKRLLAENIKSIIVMAELDYTSHCFCVVDDHVVDVTATQFTEFQNNKIVIKHLKEVSNYGFYVGQAEFRTVKELVKYQKKNWWDDKQLAHYP